MVSTARRFEFFLTWQVKKMTIGVMDTKPPRCPVFRVKERSLRIGEQGFTLIETISVLVILTIIAVVALVRIPSLTEYTKEMEINTLKTHFRYVQSRAMGSEIPWGIRFTDSNTYRFLEGGATSQLVPPGADIVDAKLNPDNDPLTVNLVGLSLGTALTDHNFDEKGSPVSLSLNGDGTVNEVLLLDADIAIRDADGTELFKVTAYTGFIQ